MIHRHCRTEVDQLRDQVTRLEAELRAADRRAADAQAEAARQRANAESASAARWDAVGDVEQLRERLTASRERTYELECAVNDLEQDRDDHQQVLATRRLRAAQTALGDATQIPWHEKAAHKAAVAAALLSLPLEHYDIDLTYTNGRWRVAGEPAAGRYADQNDDTARLLALYGIDASERQAITQAASRPAAA